MRLNFLRSLLLFTVLASGCIYSPSDEPLTVVQKPSTSSIVQLTNANTGSGSFHIYSPITFMLSVTPSDKAYYSVEIYLNDEYVYSESNSGNEVYFDFDPGNYGSGVKELRAVIIYATGSGSLADQLGREVIRTEKTWTLNIDLDAPAALSAPTVAIENGKLMVRWNAPSKKNFYNYILHRTYILPNGSTVNRDFTLDKSATSFHDTDYVGTKVAYSIDMDGYQVYISGAATQFDCPAPMQISFVEGYPTPYYTYTLSQLYGNALQSRWYVTNIGPIGNRSVSSPGTKSITDLKFGDFKKLEVSHEPITAEANPHVYKITSEVYLGKRIHAYDGPISYVSSLLSYFVVKGSYLYKINGSTMVATDSIQTPGNCELIVSPNGVQAYLMHDDRLKFSKVDLGTLTITETISVSSLIPWNKKVLFSHGISDDNQFYFDTDGTVYVVDFTSKTIRWQAASSSPVVMSPNGVWFVHKSKLYERATDGLSYNFKADLNSSPSNTFFKSNTHFFVHVWGATTSTIELYDAESVPNQFNKIFSYKSVSGIKMDYPSYDPVSNTVNGIDVVGGVVKEYNTYDGDNLTFIRTVVPTTETFSLTIQRVNGKYFHPRGLALQIP